MYCKKCGTKLKDDALFCKNCGTPVGQISDDAIQQDYELEQDVLKQDEPKDHKTNNDKKRKKKKKNAIPIIFLFLLISSAFVYIVSRHYRMALWSTETGDDSISQNSSMVATSDTSSGTIYELKDENVSKDETTGFAPLKTSCL